MGSMNSLGLNPVDHHGANLVGRWGRQLQWPNICRTWAGKMLSMARSKLHIGLRYSVVTVMIALDAFVTTQDVGVCTVRVMQISKPREPDD